MRIVLALVNLPRLLTDDGGDKDHHPRTMPSDAVVQLLFRPSDVGMGLAA